VLPLSIAPRAPYGQAHPRGRLVTMAVSELIKIQSKKAFLFKKKQKLS
jgi:hypothetical protein